MKTTVVRQDLLDADDLWDRVFAADKHPTDASCDAPNAEHESFENAVAKNPIIRIL